MEKTQKNLADQIKSSLSVLRAVGDPTVINEAQKIESAISEINKTTVPMLETYAKNLKSFDEGLVSKYGFKAARVIEFGLVIALAIKAFVFA